MADLRTTASAEMPEAAAKPEQIAKEYDLVITSYALLLRVPS